MSGLALVAALPLQVAGFVMHPASERAAHASSALYGPAHLVLFVSWLLVLLGLPGLYAWQAERAGRLGMVGFVATIVAVAYHLYLTLYEAFAVPVMADEPATRALIGPDGPLGHGAGALGPLAFGLVLGFPVLGWAMVRARRVPPLSGWLQVAGVPGFVLVAVVLGLVLGDPVGPEGETWLGGMLPIALLYWLVCAGYAVAGATLRRAGTEQSAEVPAPPLPVVG